MASANSTVLNEYVPKLREMLLIGLASYGELERIDDKIGLIKMCNISLPLDLKVIHPTGSADTICDFADALRSLDSIAFALQNDLANAAKPGA